ncbi:hypothetical protein BaRGS_00032976 [Batillaria attramentaria]|uniref:Uncharacterized protein n=1 Tax=Batillaria attramentaria TaxID=370345 RepID=A0ABD0JLZ3_9CAEN
MGAMLRTTVRDFLSVLAGNTAQGTEQMIPASLLARSLHFYGLGDGMGDNHCMVVNCCGGGVVLQALWNECASDT